MEPLVKYEGNPIRKVDWENEFYGPGHNSVVADASRTMWMFYHTKVEPSVGWERVVRMNELAFDAEGNLYVVLYDDDDDTDDDASDDDTGDDDTSDDDSDVDDDGSGGEGGCGC